MNTILKKKLAAVLTVVACIVSLSLTVKAFQWGVLRVGIPGDASGGNSFSAALLDQYDRHMTNEISTALEGVLDIEKVYWLNDSELIAPKPDPSKFGKSTNPAELQWLLDEAAEILEGQPTLFHTGITLYPGSEITYYLDETIFSISWREWIDEVVYTFSEVKIAHASQFRRFLADGEYGSEKQYYCTQMAETVNAVTASNADFYKYRTYGTVIYNGQVYRANGRVDTCCIDDKGEMIFIHRGEINTQEEAEAFVKEHNIRFSISFGPIMIEDGKNVVPRQYGVGQIWEPYSRAGLGYLGERHYLLATAGFGEYRSEMPTVWKFANQLLAYGCEKAYTLDGGQTATIVSNNELMNIPDYGTQRTVSDIIYFATAVPDGE